MSRLYRTRSSQFQSSREPISRATEQMFTCVHCQLPISCAPEVSGVQNRNHCPSCLWSRHMDWRVAGDRRSTCRAPMEPVGLTTKHSRNRYASDRDGEVMLIHRCASCGKLVINRVAADDWAEAILDLLDRTHVLASLLAPALAADGVTMLTAADRALVHRRLFGAGALFTQHS